MLEFSWNVPDDEGVENEKNKYAIICFGNVSLPKYRTY